MHHAGMMTSSLIAVKQKCCNGGETNLKKNPESDYFIALIDAIALLRKSFRVVAEIMDLPP